MYIILLALGLSGIILIGYGAENSNNYHLGIDVLATALSAFLWLRLWRKIVIKFWSQKRFFPYWSIVATLFLLVECFLRISLITGSESTDTEYIAPVLIPFDYRSLLSSVSSDYIGLVPAGYLTAIIVALMFNIPEFLLRMIRVRAWERSVLIRGLQSAGDGAAWAYHTAEDQLREANTRLDNAEEEFSLNSYSPFWSEIEQAVRCLNKAKELMSNVDYYTNDYRSTLSKANAKSRFKNFPLIQFPLTYENIVQLASRTSTVTNRMDEIGRRALKDFKFASIYESRRTNTMLESGFVNLEAAISGMRVEIGGEIDRLSSSVNELHSAVAHYHEEVVNRPPQIIYVDRR